MRMGSEASDVFGNYLFEKKYLSRPKSGNYNKIKVELLYWDKISRITVYAKLKIFAGI